LLEINQQSAYVYICKPINTKQLMVEAGGVELQVGIANTQVIDSAISLIAPFAWFAR
jgi:hypothetical protein